MGNFGILGVVLYFKELTSILSGEAMQPTKRRKQDCLSVHFRAEIREQVGVLITLPQRDLHYEKCENHCITLYRVTRSALA